MYISAQTSSGLKPDVLGANSSGHGLSGWRRFVKNAAIHRSRAFTFLAEAVVPRGHWCPGGLWESVGAGLGFHDDGDRDWPLLGGSHTCEVPHGHRTVPPRCQSTPVQTHWGGYSQLLGRFLCKQGPPPYSPGFLDLSAMDIWWRGAGVLRDSLWSGLFCAV